MDRVKAAAETAQALHTRLTRGARPPQRFSQELMARLALQLHGIKAGIADVHDGAPVEVACAIEPVFDRASDRDATLAWCDKLVSMYRGWAARRRMHLSDASGRNPEAPLLLIGGFGAHRVLSREAGLHVWEASEGAATRVAARVVLVNVPLGDVPAAKSRALVVKALAQAPRSSAVVRRYRGQPPLVRNADGRWRSGRLDLVLAGEFDLIGAEQQV
jgi:ATP-dependent Clp protease ATP-binding subunit ClpC